MHPEASNCPRGPSAPSDCLFAGSSGVTPGEAEEASLAVPPSVLTLGVNRNIKSLLGGQETGNNQNIVSCPRPGRWAVCHRPSPAAWGFPGLASPSSHCSHHLLRGLQCPQWATPQDTISETPESWQPPHPHTRAPPGQGRRHGTGPPSALGPQGTGAGTRGGPQEVARVLGAHARHPVSASRAGPTCLLVTRGQRPVRWPGAEGGGGGGGLPSHPRALGPQAPFPTDLPPQRALQEPVGVPRSPQWPLSEGETEAQPLAPGPFP